MIVYILLKVDSPQSPAFFKQQRVGRNGKTFDIYKFRSMVPNAEDILKSNQALYDKYVANGYKLPTKDEHTLAITKDGPKILTSQDPEFDAKYL
ncbi:hypothetical protein GQS40_08805|uniref:Bacterial sugar transferase domain-containing protein n=1 Tax=Leuconostoc lactis TaxID=1246 RepID=A0A6L7ACI5_LEULA|nr:hypothetical protein [Leuconostoc lactis]